MRGETFGQHSRREGLPMGMRRRHRHRIVGAVLGTAAIALVALVLAAPTARAGPDGGPPSLVDTLTEAAPSGSRIRGDDPTRIDGTRAPEDYRSGQPASGLPAAADTQFAEVALLPARDARKIVDRFASAGCGGRRGMLTYVCPNGDAPDPATLGKDALAVHLALGGPLPDALTPGTKLGFALLTQNAGAAQAPSSGSLTGGSDAYRTVFTSSATTVQPVYQFWTFPWAPVAAAADPPFNLQILDDRGSVTWILDPAVLSARQVTGLRPKTFIEGSVIANPIPDLAPSNPTAYYPYDPTTIARLRIVTPSTTGLVTTDGGTGSSLGWWLLAGGGLVVTGGGIAMRRRRLVADGSAADVQWAAILDANERAELQILEASTQLGNHLGSLFADYNAQARVFARAYSRAVHGLDILEETRKENEGKIAVAQLADVVINLVQVAQLGRGAYRWYRGRQIATMARQRAHAVRVMDRLGLHGTVQGTGLPPGFVNEPWMRVAIPANLPAPPQWFDPSKAFTDDFGGGAQAYWHMSALAAEVGADLPAMINRAARASASQDATQVFQTVLTELRVQVASARGVPMISIRDYMRLFNLERAEQGFSAYDLEDVRWFLDAHRRDPDLMTKLDNVVGDWAVGHADLIEKVDPAIDPGIQASLRRILQNEDLARAVADTPPGSPGVVDISMPGGSTLRLAGDGSGTATFPDVFTPPYPGTGSFPGVLQPPVPGGPIVGVGPGQGLVAVPPTIAPGTRLPVGFGPDIPPTLGDIPPTLGDIPPTLGGFGHPYALDGIPSTLGDIPSTLGDVPPTLGGYAIPPTLGPGDVARAWAGDLADVTPTWTGGALPPLGATVPPPPLRVGPLDPMGFDGTVTLAPPDALGATLAPGAMSVDDAARASRTFLDEGRRLFVTGRGAGPLLHTLPANTPVSMVTTQLDVDTIVDSTIITVPTARGDAVVATGLAGPMAGWVEAVGEATEATDAIFLVGQGAAPVIQDGVFGPSCLVDLDGLLDLGAKAGGYYASWFSSQNVWVADYSPGGYGSVSIPGLEVGMQAVCTPGGVNVFDPAMPMYANPSGPMTGGLAAGFQAGAGLELGSLDIAVDPAALDTMRADLVNQTSKLMADRDWFRTPGDYLDELDDFGVTRRGFSFAWWGGGGPDTASWFGEWGWNWVLLTSNPTETLLKRLPVIGLYDMAAEDVKTYGENHVGDFVDMSSSLSTMITELEWAAEHLGAWTAPLVTARDALDRAMADANGFAAAHPDWATRHPGEIAAKLARDAQTRGHIGQSLASMDALRARLTPLIGWLRELKYSPDGTLKHHHTLLEPTSILRVSGAFLQLMDVLGGALLLTPPPDDAPAQEEGRYKPSLDEIVEQKEKERAAMPPEDYHKYEVDDIPRPTPEQIREDYGDR